MGAERGVGRVGAPPPATLALPSAADSTLILIALAAVSTSAPLIAATAAPALAIAFWRNAMASVVLVPWAAVRNRAEVRSLDRREWRLSALAGVLLAAHFATWVPSVTLTSVAAATALTATQPIWAALIARRRGEDISRRAWVGIVLAVLGAALVTGVDVTVSARAFAGDLLALVGGVFAAAYVTAGAEVRRTVSTTVYTTVCYGLTALLLLAVCLVGGRQLAGYSADTWVKLVALTVGAQLLGHSVFNAVLRTTSATIVSLAILFEPVGAALIAALWLGQLPPAGTYPGLAVLLAGIAVVVTTATPRTAAMPAE